MFFLSIKPSELQLDSRLGKWEGIYVFYIQKQNQKRPLLLMPTWQKTNSRLKFYKLLYFCHTKWYSKSFWLIDVFSSTKQSCGNSVGAAVRLGSPSFQPESLQGVGTRGAGPEEVSGGRSRRGTIMTRSSSLLLGAVGPLLLCSPPSLLTLPSLAASISHNPPLPSSRQYLRCLGLSSFCICHVY